jgi:hypothetical protein
MVGCVGVIVTVSTGRCLPRTLHGRVSGGGMKFVEFLHFLNYEAQLNSIPTATHCDEHSSFGAGLRGRW